MRLARLPLLLAALLAPALTASIADAQAKDQKGQAQADDIIDRMSKAERAVLDRLKNSHPLMEVYIQNVAPDEARG
jgi:predicted NBD/HSP70 family sugar kinase